MHGCCTPCFLAPQAPSPAKYATIIIIETQRADSLKHTSVHIMLLTATAAHGRCCASPTVIQELPTHDISQGQRDMQCTTTHAETSMQLCSGVVQPLQHIFARVFHNNKKQHTPF